MNQYKSALFFLLILFFGATLTAQEDVPGRIPEYPVPYEYPEVDNIKDVLNRVRAYYESTSPQKIIDAETGKEITGFSKLNEHARVSGGFSSEWSYTHGVVLSAFEYIDDVTGDPTFFANNTRFYDFVIEHLPYFRKNAEQFGSQSGGWRAIVDMHALDDCGSIGAAMIKTYQKNKNDDYLELINIIADYISNKQFRLEDGTLARHRPQYQSIWADDLYMSVPFLANMGALTGDTKYFDDAVKQILQMAERLYIPEKELFDHGWNVTSGDYDPRFYWGRANGWTLMAMAELLGVLPEDHPGRDEILHLYRSMIRSLAGLQDGTGFWHNMLDKTDTYLETSCTAMFTFAVAKGINEGWINHVYGPVALTGWNAIKTRVLENGAVDGTCEGTTFAHDNTYYYYRGKSIYATHGYGPVLYAGAEMIRLLQNDKIEVQTNRINARNSTFHYRLKSEWPQQLAFPTAEGYGKYAKGGRGGVVYEVTNLNDSGEGSLRAAIEASGPRTVVFRVSGNIELESPIKIENPYITIAGQTAPGDGICLKNHPLSIDANHVIVRYIRVRPGDVSGDDYDAVSSRYRKHIILDHISASWSVDECMSVYHCDSITVQWCIISESMSGSNHIKGSHGFGGIWGSNYGTYHHNLLAHHSSRNPRMASGSGYTDHRNNVIYNWGFNSCYGGEGQQQGNDKFNFSAFNIVANYYKPGPATKPGEVSHRIANPSFRNENDFGKWYIADNVVEGNADVSKDNWNGGVQTDISFEKIKLDKPWPSMPIDQQTAEEAYKAVLDNAGAILPERDAIDTRIIEEVRGGYATFEGESYKREHEVADSTKVCGIIDTQNDVWGWPVLKSAPAPKDTDHDGMPDYWEDKNNLDKEDPDDRNAIAADGYTMLEKYLNGIR